MQKKEKNDIVPGVKKLAENYCRAEGRDLKEFVEESIVEKIEFEEAEKDALIMDRADADMENEGLSVEEPGNEDFKLKH
jgi:hypothetical protein